jgi:hypothetical protein
VASEGVLRAFGDARGRQTGSGRREEGREAGRLLNVVPCVPLVDGDEDGHSRGTEGAERVREWERRRVKPIRDFHLFRLFLLSRRCKDATLAQRGIAVTCGC